MGDSDDSSDCRYAGRAVEGMWGQAGTLFFHTIDQIVMWDGVEFTVLGYWAGEDAVNPEGRHYCEDAINIRGMWGNATDELFLAVRDLNYSSTDCAPQFLLWWDGSEFHWF